MIDDLEVTGNVWLSPGGVTNPLFRALKAFCDFAGFPLPLSKDSAVRVPTFSASNPTNPIFWILPELSPRYQNPDFASHPEVWKTAHIDVWIGEPIKTNSVVVDDFNALLIELLNAGTGNILKAGKVLSWNLFLLKPRLVDPTEWTDHARKWRDSIDSGANTHQGSDVFRFAAGTRLQPNIAAYEEEQVKASLRKHFGGVFDALTL